MIPLLEVRGLKKYFPVLQGIWSKEVGQVKAVDEVSFSLVQGETFGLVGESGCGKSTISKMVLLLEGITSGDILFRGKNIFQFKGKELAQYRSSVQAVFQDPTSSLNPRMRIRDTVTEPLVVNHTLSNQGIQEKLDEALSQVGLNAEAAQLFPHEFSGGQRQRIALARALIVGPSLIILDEPVSALDVSIQAQIMNLLRDLQAKLGIAYLFIAHNLATVRYMSHQIGVMYLGKLVERGPAQELFAHRLHPYSQVLFSAALPFHPDTPHAEVNLQGEVPSPLNPPSGCRFHPRCSQVTKVCSETEPPLEETSAGHFVACHLVKKA